MQVEDRKFPGPNLCKLRVDTRKLRINRINTSRTGEGDCGENLFFVCGRSTNLVKQACKQKQRGCAAEPDLPVREQSICDDELAGPSHFGCDDPKRHCER